MTNITLAIPEEIKDEMREFPKINWSYIVRRAINLEIERQKMKKEFIKKLEKEKKDIEWAVKVVRKGRKNEVSG
ncbi:MAG: hypothetical protein Q8P57_04705 [Candidatus Pacearchaeota archaeon]|nr:hypothetical protein [Candidatus Pacearchaeota archaeon]